MQADLRAAKAAAEQRHASLEEGCHAKIETLQAAHAEQLSSQQVRTALSFIVRLRAGSPCRKPGMQEAAQEKQDRAEKQAGAMADRIRQVGSEEASAASKLRSAQRQAEKLRSELSGLQGEHAAQLLAQSTLRSANEKLQLERERWERQSRACTEASSSALQDMDGFLQKLSSTIAAQNIEIAALQATVQQQCRERVALQSRLDAMEYERTQKRLSSRSVAAV